MFTGMVSSYYVVSSDGVDTEGAENRVFSSFKAECSAKRELGSLFKVR